ncbi:DUF2512 family protein [Paracerasibacillus soli]|uniref:DUF2512 family protein n=1 Tax=Paracerasibacillus soli TaxID=480284 RepID=A0ABU5CV89_9BACI|nr:DUF2512 family protein [Virgibacillus soli]MDY0410299.1 DUF2512 family protein [Virgibacillus soli]
MDHLKILGIKFAAIFITVLSLFGIFNHASLMSLFWMGVITTVVSYLIGDMIILRRFGNIAATIADFGLVFLTLWFLSATFIGTAHHILPISFLSAFFITCVEMFVHGYIRNHLSETERNDRGTFSQFQNRTWGGT